MVASTSTLALSVIVLAPLALSAPAQSENAQCGGVDFVGSTACMTGFVCTKMSDSFSQCLKANPTVQAAAATSTTAEPTTAPSVGPSHKVGRLPALGWNSWNAYHCDINEDKILTAAKQFGQLGLDKAGYEYVNIDDCWPLQDRDSTTGKIVPDPAKFPDGISGTASQVHALGLKLGIYSDAGTQTCAGYPGSLGNEDLDATTFAEWGVDYLKYDNCNVPSNWSDAATPPDGDWYNSNSAIRYRRMTAALVATNRPFQLDLCIWGEANVWEWGARVGHSWRMSGDSSPTWDYITEIMVTNSQHLDTIDFFSHNDMDMMEIGNGDLTLEEERTHFAVWAFMKSPILLGTDLTALDASQVQIITNKELLAFSQDPVFGTPAKPFTATASAPTTSPPEFYAGRSVRGVHVFVVNTGDASEKTFEFANVPGLGAGKFKVHDMWTSKDLGVFKDSFNVTLAAHDTAALLVSRV